MRLLPMLALAFVLGASLPALADPGVRAHALTLNSATSNAAVTVKLMNSEGTIGFAVTGLTAASATLTLEGSNDDGATWTSINGLANGTVSTMTADQQFQVAVAGRTNVRLRVSSIGSGNVTISYYATQAASSGSGTLIGSVTAQSSTGGFTAVTVGASSGQALAAASSRALLAIDNESTTASIACAFGATAAINTAGSRTIPAGAIATWSGLYVPADAVNCIASAPGTPVTIEAH